MAKEKQEQEILKFLKDNSHAELEWRQDDFNFASRHIVVPVVIRKHMSINVLLIELFLMRYFVYLSKALGLLSNLCTVANSSSFSSNLEKKTGILNR